MMKRTAAVATLAFLVLTGCKHNADGGASDPAPSGDVEAGVEAQAAIDLTNGHREKAGCEPVEPNQDLMNFAQDWSERQLGQGMMLHSEGPPGFGTWAENVGFGQETAEEVIDDWMNSPEHAATIVDCKYTVIGVGFEGKYWTQVFGR